MKQPGVGPLTGGSIPRSRDGPQRHHLAEPDAGQRCKRQRGEPPRKPPSQRGIRCADKSRCQCERSDAADDPPVVVVHRLSRLGIDACRSAAQPEATASRPSSARILASFQRTRIRSARPAKREKRPLASAAVGSGRGPFPAERGDVASSAGSPRAGRSSRRCAPPPGCSRFRTNRAWCRGTTRPGGSCSFRSSAADPTCTAPNGALSRNTPAGAYRPAAAPCA